MADNYLDKAGATYLVSKIKAVDSGKVDKVTGKGLSTNDFTNDLKNKLDGTESVSSTEKSTWNGKQDAVSFNTAYNASTNKAATMKDVTDAVKDLTGIDFQIVSSLPTTGTKGVIYLVSNGGTGQNVYDEYIWLSSANKYEKIGTTSVDLSGYLKKTDMVAITNSEIDAMFT